MENENNSGNDEKVLRTTGDNVLPPPETVISPQPTIENEVEPTSTDQLEHDLSPDIAPTTANPVVEQQPVTPEPAVITAISTTDNSAYSDTKVSQKNKKRSKMTKVLLVFVLIVIFGAAIGGSYMFGKSHEKIVIQTPELRPIDLPPQAVVVEECAVGRGKQFILPKDIPIGPVYDVVNTQVIAIEYSLEVAGLLSNSDVFSDTILKLTKEYPVDHFSIVPVTPKPGEQIQGIQLIMFVVSKEEASKITCK